MAAWLPVATGGFLAAAGLSVLPLAWVFFAFMSRTPAFDYSCLAFRLYRSCLFFVLGQHPEHMAFETEAAMPGSDFNATAGAR
jgi:hypothetical protein